MPLLHVSRTPFGVAALYASYHVETALAVLLTVIVSVPLNGLLSACVLNTVVPARYAWRVMPALNSSEKSSRYSYAVPSAVPGKVLPCWKAFQRRPAINGDVGVPSASVALFFATFCAKRLALRFVSPLRSAAIVIDSARQ